LKKDVRTGFLGIGAGVEVFYKDKNYISTTIATGLDFPYFFPFHVDQSGTYETEKSITRNVSLRNHHQFGIFDFGYGAQYSMLYWQKSYFYDAGIPASPDKVEIFETSNVGLSLATHIFTSEYFKVGFLYQPSIYKLTPERKIDYQHFGSLEFVWRIPILKL
jgi:hypothetical protein